jgi:hypothetical protein
MVEQDDSSRDLANLVVSQVGSLQETGDPWEAYRLVDPDGVAVQAVAVFFRDLQAAGRSVATVRSYGMDLLRWFPAPRGALLYPLLSREGSEEISLGLMAYLALKEKGESSMPNNPVVMPRRMG